MPLNRLPNDTFISQVLSTGGGTDPLIDLYVVKAPNGQPATFALNPAYRPGDRVQIVDGAGNAGSQPITITATETILGHGHSLTINTDLAGVALAKVQDGPNEVWVVQAGGAGGGGSSPPSHTQFLTNQNFDIPSNGNWYIFDSTLTDDPTIELAVDPNDGDMVNLATDTGTHHFHVVARGGTLINGNPDFFGTNGNGYVIVFFKAQNNWVTMQTTN